MSSFFRPASEISASHDTSTTQSLDWSATKPAELASRPHGESVSELAPPSAGPSIASQHYQDVLVHALLEEKCLNDVCHELNANSTGSPRYTKDDPHVRSQATERYRVLTGQLASHGLVSSGLEGDNFRHVRQTARDGLSLLSNQLNALDLSTEDSSAPRSDRHLIRQPLRRLLTDYPQSHGNIPFHSLDTGLLPGRQPLGLASPLLPSHPLLDSTRYVRDFDEVCMLGKGGYGSVFQCNHRLDGRAYAVKKIILGPSVLQKVQQRGEGELNIILGELRTMARIEHPNIVRYFGGWVEWSNTSAVGQSSSSGLPRLITQGTSEVSSLAGTSTSQTQSQSCLRFEVPREASEEDGILFENTSSLPTRANDTTTDSGGSIHLRRTGTRSTLATVTDEGDVEEISRQSPIIESSATGSNHIPAHDDTGLCLTLHIQMSLYPLTLAHYLTSSTISLDNSQLTLRHCFHLSSSIALMLAILDGVQHLHAHGIVHRDLKPANIFLKPSICTPVTIPVGTIDPLSCSDCGDPDASPRPCIDPKAQQLRMGVCIGDFGLVSVLTPDQDVAARPLEGGEQGDISLADSPPRPGPGHLKQVGTELYRPTQPHPKQAQTGQAHISQDIYALGIIFTELLCCFDTRMERHDVLSGLRKESKIPPAMRTRRKMQKAGEVVLKMLAATEGEQESGCEDVREWLNALMQSE